MTKALIHTADPVITAVGRAVAVVAHDKETSLRHSNGITEIDAAVRRLKRIRLIQRHAVHIHDAAFKVDRDRFALGGDHALYDRLAVEASLRSTIMSPRFGV